MDFTKFSVFLLFGFILVCVNSQSQQVNSQRVIEQPYCSFFNNRAPKPQHNLKNCTWYKENSCCVQREIEATFSKVKPLQGSSKECEIYLNYLMCYICAPDQYLFYGGERLTVCVEFCDKIYSACGSAILKGSHISEIYTSGSEFCRSRRFQIDSIANNKCFYYDVKVSGSHYTTRPWLALPLVATWWLLFGSVHPMLF